MTIISAKPTIHLDNEPSDVVSNLMQSMEMEEQEEGLSSLELQLDNIASLNDGEAGLAFEDNSLVKLGAAIRVGGGDESEPGEIFRGVVTCVEADFAPGATPRTIVLAEDLLQKARMTRRTKIHEEVSLRDLAQAVADELELRLVANGFEQPIGSRAQLNESDLGFLRRMLQRYDGDLQVVGDELHLSPRSDVQRGEPLVLHYQSEASDAGVLLLRRVRASADLAHQTTEVTVSGWDAEQGARVAGRSTGANLRGDPSMGSTGADLLEAAGLKRNHHIGHLHVANEDEATALADAAFDARARKFVCLEGTTQGDPRLRVGASLEVKGLGPRFDSQYYVCRTRHRWDTRRGYEVDFEAESAYWGV